MVQLNNPGSVSRALVLPVLAMLCRFLVRPEIGRPFHHPVETEPTVVNVVLPRSNVVLVRERKPESAAVPVAVPHLVAVLEPQVIHVLAGPDLDLDAVALADRVFTHCRFLLRSAAAPSPFSSHVQQDFLGTVDHVLAAGLAQVVPR